MPEAIYPVTTGIDAAPYFDIGTTSPAGTCKGYIWPGYTSVTAYPTADMAIYVPIRVQQNVLLRKAWIAQGGTGTNNFDIGIYYPNKTRITHTTATAKVASAVIKVVDITDVFIYAGLYYLAFVSTSNTDTFSNAAETAPNPASWGVFTQTGVTSAALPDPAVWTVDNTLAYVPAFGFTASSVPA